MGPKHCVQCDVLGLGLQGKISAQAHENHPIGIGIGEGLLNGVLVKHTTSTLHNATAQMGKMQDLIVCPAYIITHTAADSALQQDWWPACFIVWCVAQHAV